MRRIVLSSLILALILAAQFANAHGAAAAAPFTDLDNAADQWEMWIDPPGRYAEWELGGVSNPSVDGRAVRMGLLGGDASTGLHAYRSLPAVPSARTFQMSLKFRYASSANAIQAIEFSLSKWQNNKRWEWAVQWQNVQDGSSEQGEPQSWRLWDGDSWINTGAAQQLAPDRWHTFTLTGEIDRNGQVRYSSIVCNGVTTRLGQTYAPTGGEYEAVTVAVQLDGDEAMNPQQLFLDKVQVEAR